MQRSELTVELSGDPMHALRLIAVLGVVHVARIDGVPVNIERLPEHWPDEPELPEPPDDEPYVNPLSGITFASEEAANLAISEKLTADDFLLAEIKPKSKLGFVVDDVADVIKALRA